MKTGVVILAAGESSRMGGPKQLLAYRGTTLLNHTIATARALGDALVAVVLGARVAEIRAQLEAPDALVVENPAWPAGMGGSLRCGLHALLDAQPEMDGAIFLPCDQPLLTADTLRKLIATHARTGAAIVASEYDGTLGTPAFFAREFFLELLTLDGAVGARQIIWTHRARAVGEPFPEGAMDLDTPADYARLQEFCREISTPVSA